MRRSWKNCPRCPRTFSSSAAVKSHLSFHGSRAAFHAAKVRPCLMPLGPDGARCPFRGDLGAMKLHLEDDHGVEGEFRCDRCDFAANWRKSLTSHLSKAHGARAGRLRCVYCPFAAPSRVAELKAHVRATHGVRRQGYRCHLCQWRSRDNSGRGLKEHLVEVHGVAGARVKDDAEVFSCVTCGVKCASMQVLARHALRHRERRACKRCLRGGDADPFVGDVGQMEVHLETVHAARGVFECSLCSYVSNWRENFGKHVRSAHGATLSSVQACRFCCQQIGHGMEEHVRREHRHPHTNLLRCHLCNEGGFDAGGKLLQHLAQSHGVAVPAVWSLRDEKGDCVAPPTQKPTVDEPESEIKEHEIPVLAAKVKVETPRSTSDNSCEDDSSSDNSSSDNSSSDDSDSGESSSSSERSSSSSSESSSSSSDSASRSSSSSESSSLKEDEEEKQEEEDVPPSVQSPTNSTEDATETEHGLIKCEDISYGKAEDALGSCLEEVVLVTARAVAAVNSRGPTEISSALDSVNECLSDVIASLKKSNEGDFPD